MSYQDYLAWHIDQIGCGGDQRFGERMELRMPDRMISAVLALMCDEDYYAIRKIAGISSGPLLTRGLIDMWEKGRR